jgi:hypothetical protein
MIANGVALQAFTATWPEVRDRRPTAAVLESLDAPKLAELRELVASLVVTQGRKVVVFSQWRRMLELAAWAVSDLLAAAGKRALFFTGQEGARRRTHNLVDFHDDPSAAVLFLTDAGGVGLNLQKAASACVNLELPWNPAVLEQRIGRIHRLGQDRPIDVYNLMSRSSIEERIAGLVADKRALFKGVFEGVTDELRFDGGSQMTSLLETLTAPEEALASVDDASDDGADPSTAIVQDLGGGDAEAAEPGALAGQGAAASISGPAPAVEDGVAALFGAVAVQRRADGGLVIEAPPQAARALQSLFEGMARLMAMAADGAGAGARDAAPLTGEVE